jgi:hypothetical protein
MEPAELTTTASFAGTERDDGAAERLIRDAGFLPLIPKCLDRPFS